MIRGLFLDIINQSIATGYLIAAVIAARALLKRAPKIVCCILWLLVGIRLIMPFSIESVFSLIPSGVEVQNDIRQIAGANVADVPKETVAGTDTSVKTDYIDEETIWAMGNNHESPESVNRSYVFFSIASAVWCSGMGMMLLYLLFSWLRLGRRVRMSIPKEQGGIKYYQCETIDTPFLFGLVTPRIYVPSGLCGADLDYVLKHETAHAKRRDYLIKLAGYVLLTVYWFHPLAWAAYLLLCRDIELACDERVVRTLGGEEKKAYSLALLTCAVNRKTIAACPVAFGETGVKGRVKNIFRYKKPSFWAIAAAVIVVVVIAVCFMTEKSTADAAVNDSGGKQFVMVNNSKTQAAQNTVRDLGGINNTDIADIENEQLENDMDGAFLPAENLIVDTDAHNEITTHNYYINPESYVRQWAEAFCNRDGQAIIALAEEDMQEELSEAFGLSQGVNDNNEPYAAFGWSSPWPQGSSYRIVSASGSEAVILYYAWVSDPHVTVWREELSYTIRDGEFRVTSQDMQFLEGICVAEEFYAAYPDGVIDGTMMDYYAYNQAGEALNENAKNANMAFGAYAGLYQPDTAAINLLNLLKNQNKVTAVVEYTNEEKTEAVVTFAFLENASTAKVRMIKPYGKDSIWLPQTY